MSKNNWIEGIFRFLDGDSTFEAFTPDYFNDNKIVNFVFYKFFYEKTTGFYRWYVLTKWKIRKRLN